MRIKALFLSLLMVGLWSCKEKPAQESCYPNVVIIYADDLGYGDVQSYNPNRGKIPTPNIDRLAAEGMRFTDAHSSSAVCSPSRVSLMTGLNSARQMHAGTQAVCHPAAWHREYPGVSHQNQGH